MEDEIDELLEQAVGKTPSREALEAVRDHADAVGEEHVRVIETVFDHYGTMLRYLRHHR